MRYLVDTHSLLWFAEDEAQLSPTALLHLENEENDLCFSTASAWEIAIKVSIGKLKLNSTVDRWIPGNLSRIRVELLHITLPHIARVAQLPMHHRDPFDRMLAAQCFVEKLPIISADKIFDAYGIQRIW